MLDWNVSGLGVSLAAQNQQVFTKGYGYRDYEKQLPFDADTRFPIASNTKLFVAIAAGLLVAEGKLSFDEPLRDCVPTIRFYDDALTNRGHTA